MNLWECQQPHCLNKVVGIGGAIGLRAIGWYFEKGPIIYCPGHNRRAEISCTYEKPCKLCLEVKEIRKTLEERL